MPSRPSQLCPAEAQVWAVGERVHARLADAGLPLMGLFAVPNSVRAITPLVGQILVESETRHSQGEVDELYLFYNRPTSGSALCARQSATATAGWQWRHKLAEIPWPTRNLPEVMGSGTATLRALIREYLFISLFRACAESLASENASRLAAMERADKKHRRTAGDSPRHIPSSSSEWHRRGTVRRDLRLRGARRTAAAITRIMTWMIFISSPSR